MLAAANPVAALSIQELSFTHIARSYIELDNPGYSEDSDFGSGRGPLTSDIRAFASGGGHPAMLTGEVDGHLNAAFVGSTIETDGVSSFDWFAGGSGTLFQYDFDTHADFSLPEPTPFLLEGFVSFSGNATPGYPSLTAANFQITLPGGSVDLSLSPGVGGTIPILESGVLPAGQHRVRIVGDVDVGSFVGGIGSGSGEARYQLDLTLYEPPQVPLHPVGRIALVIALTSMTWWILRRHPLPASAR